MGCYRRSGHLRWDDTPTAALPAGSKIGAVARQVATPGQDAEATATKYESALGDRAGTIECIPPDDC